MRSVNYLKTIASVLLVLMGLSASASAQGFYDRHGHYHFVPNSYYSTRYVPSTRVYVTRRYAPSYTYYGPTYPAPAYSYYGTPYNYNYNYYGTPYTTYYDSDYYYQSEPSKTRNMVIGGVLGAVGGAILGGKTGAVIGAGAGTGAGYLIYRHKKHRHYGDW